MILKITMPDDTTVQTFTNFNSAIKFCEKEFKYGKTIEVDVWREIKKSDSLETLKDFLWHDGLWVELHSE